MLKQENFSKIDLRNFGEHEDEVSILLFFSNFEEGCMGWLCSQNWNEIFPWPNNQFVWPKSGNSKPVGSWIGDHLGGKLSQEYQVYGAHCGLSEV